MDSPELNPPGDSQPELPLQEQLSEEQQEARIRNACVAAQSALEGSISRGTFLGGLFVVAFLTAGFAGARGGAFHPPLGPLVYAASLGLILLLLWLIPTLWTAAARQRSAQIRETLQGIGFVSGLGLFGLGDTLAGLRVDWTSRMHLLLVTSTGGGPASPRDHGNVDVAASLQTAMLLGQIRQYYRQCLLAGWKPLAAGEMLADVCLAGLPVLSVLVSMVLILSGKAEGGHGFDPPILFLMISGGLSATLVGLRIQLAQWSFAAALSEYLEDGQKSG